MPDPVVRMVEVAKRLLERTRKSAVAWTKSGSGSETFQTGVGAQLVTIHPRDGDGNHPFVLTLWKRDEDSEEERKPWVQVEKIDSMQQTVDVSETLGALWREARADALSINESIDAALEVLSDQ
jgi:hypothetical protein